MFRGSQRSPLAPLGSRIWTPPSPSRLRIAPPMRLPLLPQYLQQNPRTSFHWRLKRHPLLTALRSLAQPRRSSRKRRRGAPVRLKRIEAAAFLVAGKSVLRESSAVVNSFSVRRIGTRISIIVISIIRRRNEVNWRSGIRRYFHRKLLNCSTRLLYLFILASHIAFNACILGAILLAFSVRWCPVVCRLFL